MLTSTLKVRCLGSFEIHDGDQQVEGFESQKVRALLAYLVCHRDRPISRDFLAGLLWPEKQEEAARRNLRQALYNLKRALGQGGVEPVVAVQSQLQLNSAIDCWLDVDIFEQSCRRGLQPGSRDPHYLAEAVRLYRGDFLEEFFLKDSESFGRWMLTEQTRLRESVIEVLHVLIESYLGRGEFRLGTRYARRLLTIDALSESAYRYLIQLYGNSGRRGRALAQYEELRQVLATELGVEPSEETQQVLQAMLTPDDRSRSEEEEKEPVGPLVPMVGRREAYRQLDHLWQGVLANGAGLTLVEGEGGVGKTRLVRSFLDAVSSRSGTVVLQGKCDRRVPTSYQPIVRMFTTLLAQEVRQGNSERVYGYLPRKTLQHVARLLPELVQLQSGLQPSEPLDSDSVEEFFASLHHFLSCWGPQGEKGTFVVFLDDLHLADQETLAFLDYLLRQERRVPFWLIATCQPGNSGNDLRQVFPSGVLSGARKQTVISWVSLERIDDSAVEEIAASLLTREQAPALVKFLQQQGQGLPAVLAECVNVLWDEGALVEDVDSWSLEKDPESLTIRPTDALGDLIRHRLAALPASTRRMAVLASIIGQPFAAELLRRAEDEHFTVVDLGLRILLERWLLQRHSGFWWSPRQESPQSENEDHQQLYEFSHSRIRRAVYHSVSPKRRIYLHGVVARVLEEIYDDEDRTRQSELLAFHYFRAECWERAFPFLRQSAQKALALCAPSTARDYLERALDAATRSARVADIPDRELWNRRQQEVLSSLGGLTEL